RAVLGRVPRDVPKVTWTVAGTSQGTLGTSAITTKQLVGHVDNTAYPAISVDIRMTLVTPADVKSPVPVMMMFSGFGGFPQTRPAAGAATRAAPIAGATTRPAGAAGAGRGGGFGGGFGGPSA